MKRVLVVDDSEDLRFTLAQLLKIEGYEVTEASNGAQAIELALTAEPDLILLDLSLPVIDGVEAAKQIRRQERMKSVPIIALSGHELDDIQTSAQGAGFTDYLTKPVDFDALARMLSKYLPAES